MGARPNFIKMAPVILEQKRRGLKQITVHTGQHYDTEMSTVFFDALHMPKPDIDLNVGSGSHADQTARVMMAFEPVCHEIKPDLLIVGGDVNSTLACALVAAKLLIPIAHVESGLRSFDRAMPEEINRVLTDHIADLLFTTEESGNENLLREGIDPERIHFVGNSMIDSLRAHLNHAVAAKPWERFGLEPGCYGVVTLHRPSNVDDGDAFADIMAGLFEIAQNIPLLFPVHPRTRQYLEQRRADTGALMVTGPLGYLEFLGLMAKASLVLTDSGGIQEETTALHVPCVTIRSSTERPITLSVGTNRLAGVKKRDIVEAANHAAEQNPRGKDLPPLWDGRASLRIVAAIEKWLAEQNSDVLAKRRSENLCVG
ncbi:MAG: non-hydrolyzing UDP-N-acetylglucosamine 2-epimerase [Nitrospirota bacterium]